MIEVKGQIKRSKMEKQTQQIAKNPVRNFYFSNLKKI
jgi:hypothetical protein